MKHELNIHCLMHVPYEGPGVITDWALKRDHSMDYTRLYEQESLPDISGIHMLVIMGGPMNVFDNHIHTWMEEEIAWVSAFIQTGKPVIGICLGAQIIAAALGADVYPGDQKEIGWHNLQFLPAVGEYMIWKEHPGTLKVFQWHGDTFDIPEGATRIASSPAFPNQGFIFGKQVIALQFHLEVTRKAVEDLTDNCRNEIRPGTYIQEEQDILSDTSHFSFSQDLLFQLLDYLRGRLV